MCDHEKIAEEALEALHEAHQMLGEKLDTSTYGNGEKLTVPDMSNTSYWVMWIRDRNAGDTLTADGVASTSCRYMAEYHNPAAPEPLRMGIDNSYRDPHMNVYGQDEHTDIAMDIPTDMLTTFGVCGSVMRGCAIPDKEIQAAIKRHIGNGARRE